MYVCLYLDYFGSIQYAVVCLVSMTEDEPKTPGEEENQDEEKQKKKKHINKERNYMSLKQ